MGNTNTNILPKILARGLKVLRERVGMVRLVNGDYAADAAKKGTTIDIPIPVTIITEDVTPSNVLPAPGDLAYDLVQVSLDNWKKNKPFALTDKELGEIDRNEHFIPMAVDESVRGLARVVNQDIFAEYKGIFGYVGTAGTTPFATTVQGATQARKLLNKQKAPTDNRRGMLDFEAEAQFLELATFSDAEKVGNDEVKIQGQMGRKFGLDWYADDDVPQHTAGTGASYLVNHAAYTAADGTDKIITVDGGTGTILVGDIVTFAGHTQTYTITSALAATVFSIYPGLQATVADNAAVTVKASHRVNLAFHRDAFAFATRTLEDAGDSEILTIKDPQTGLVLRLEKIRQYKQTMWEFDILWGAKLVRPELAVRIAG